MGRQQRKQRLLKKLKQRRWQEVTRVISHPYFFAGIIFFGVALLTLDWASRVWNEHRELKAIDQVPSREMTEETPWSFFHPYWKGDPSGSGSPIVDMQEGIRTLVNDPKGRLEHDFQVPSGLKTRVAFWMQIYSRFNSHMRVVHDRNKPSVIYGVIDFRPLYRALGSNAMVEAKCNWLEKQILRQLKMELGDAMGLSHNASVSSGERAEIQAFLSRIGAFSARDTADLIGEIRTQSGQADFFQMALYRSRNLLPHIESVFRRQALPVALSRIPFVESSFNVRAYSKGGAIGIWQFMPETARQMIRGKDESAWADPIKQTASAARVFKMYRSVLPDWGTTVTSYNSGVGRVRRLVGKYHLKNVEGLLNLTADDGLGFAGKNFYSEFLAANLVEAYKEELFDISEPVDPALVLRGVMPFPKEVCDSVSGTGLGSL